MLDSNVNAREHQPSGTVKGGAGESGTRAVGVMSVLIVDDDEDTRDALRIAFEDEGHTVIEAADGMQALASLRASVSPLVVVLDLDLPKLDGIGVLQAVAQDDTGLAVRHAFILLTAVSQERTRVAEDICAALATPLMQKPFELGALLHAVEEAGSRLPAQP